MRAEPTNSRRSNVFSRRLFLAASAMAWPLAQLPMAQALDRRRSLGTDPFALGVASGDPSSDGVVLWTRLAIDPLNGGGMPEEDLLVRYEVSEDESFSKVVRSGRTTASAELGHSVHVELQGLAPDRVYWYRFMYSDEVSRVGRTRTAPSADATLQQFRFAFASCQHYEYGYYTAYEHMAQEDLHCVVHLGDYIYEGGVSTDKVRQHNGPEIVTLDDYRNRHALYRLDPHLQSTHAAFPWIVTWDDHEFDNNCAGDISEEANVDPAAFLARRAAAYQAYYEMMPIRRSCLPNGPMMQLYRSISYGRLAQFQVLDTRQYRTDQSCGDGNKPPCEGVFDPNATLLGKTQERWLMQGLQDSPATWNILAQQVMFARVDRTPGDAVAWSMDQWAGYDVARKRLLQFFADAQVSNPIVLTGDIHTNWVNDLKVDFDDPQGPVVATEFVGTSISSGGDGAEKRADTDGVLAENPFVRFYNAERGYVSCVVTSERWESKYQVVPKVTEPTSELLTRATFVVESGKPGAHRA